mgnify:CR=1 FL=1
MSFSFSVLVITNYIYFSLFILSEQFESISLIERHKMIYKIFEKELTKEIHALQIKPLTYKEWNQKTSNKKTL